MGSIVMRGVGKVYGRGPRAHQAVRGVDLEIADGEFVVIVGPSGCGKSTLLRMVAGLEEITAGEIAIDGRVVNRLEPAERDIAMVFQNYALYPHMTVYDNMAYGLRNARVPKDAIAERVGRAAAMLELDGLLSRKPRELSGGQRQRVAMGRALVRQPKVFLFDEPLSNLDARLRAQTRIEIQRLHRELRVTSLFVTHDQVEAMTLADRIVVMNAGAIEQVGAPAEVYERPASTFVAGFIGASPMNLLDGVASKEGFVVGGDATLSDGQPGGAAAASGSRPSGVTLGVAAPRAGAVTLGARPEHAKVSGAGRWSMRVELVEMLGAERLLHGRIGAAPFVVRMDAQQAAPSPGDAIRFDVPDANLHWFDPGTGRRLSA